MVANGLLRKRQRVAFFAGEGLTEAEIIRRTKYKRAFVNKWMQRPNQNDMPRPGRRPKVTPDVLAAIVSNSERQIGGTSAAVADKLRADGIADVSPSTVRRVCLEDGLTSYTRRRTSHLTSEHKVKRLAFAREERNRDWSAVFFSDEHPFKTFRQRNPQQDRVRARRPEDVPTRGVERWGRRIQAWAAISMRGRTPLQFFKHDLNGPDYQSILEEALLPAAQQQFGRRGQPWVLQQDQATCHTSTDTQDWLDENEVEWIENWPPKGDDLNPIENLWALADARIREENVHSDEDLCLEAQRAWDSIPLATIQNAIRSIPDRLRRVRKAKGARITNVK